MRHLVPKSDAVDVHEDLPLAGGLLLGRKLHVCNQRFVNNVGATTASAFIIAWLRRRCLQIRFANPWLRNVIKARKESPGEGEDLDCITFKG